MQYNLRRTRNSSGFFATQKSPAAISRFYRKNLTAIKRKNSLQEFSPNFGYTKTSHNPIVI